MNWVAPAVCALIALGLVLRWRMISGRRPPTRFWVGLALAAPILSGIDVAASWHSVLAAWGLWLTMDGLAASCNRPSLLGDDAEAAVWALVVSLFGWAGIEYLNEYFPVWTVLGLPFHPLAREAALGLLGAPVVPTVLAAASFLSWNASSSPSARGAGAWRIAGLTAIVAAWFVASSTASLILIVVGITLALAGNLSRIAPMAAGALIWAAFDSLWSQLGPAQRFFVDYASPAILPPVLAICALAVAHLYGAVAEFLDKPRFNPFDQPQA